MKRLKIIGLMGVAGVGKDTVGGILMEAGHGASVAFADRLKQVVEELFDLSEDDLYTREGKEKPTRFICLRCPTCHSHECKTVTLDRVEHGLCNLCGSVGDVQVFRSYWTPRSILQFLGTDAFRRIDPEVWTRNTLGRAEILLDETEGRFAPSLAVPFVIVTDVRFKSEAEAIWARGGEVWKIVRASAAPLAGAQHVSEAEVDQVPEGRFQAVISNGGTLDDLRGKVLSEMDRFLAKK